MKIFRGIAVNKFRLVIMSQYFFTAEYDSK